MRALVALSLAAAAALLGPARAADRSPAACLSPGDTHDAVVARRALAPAEAIQLVRKAVPKGEVLRAALCHEASALVYRVTVLEQGGRVVRVTLDAPSGKVSELR